ncbi:MAG: 5'-nucleotidase C-terminal domain-containing protein [Bacteroidales bacterium]|jgi:2',3'-cyclic-nucleotide 2'-phosphodiesterase/3'-nucleotidase|nr:5'-nucleotidase C-terminal domain-containing protein [Bacteroidales bacterium]
MKIKTCLIKIFLFVFLLAVLSCGRSGKESVTILLTTDLHGVILPYDFIEKRDMDVSLAAISTYVNKVRQEGSPVILLDNGDNLQGQPPVYYYNFIDTVSPHINSVAMNYMGYDACTVGNHDIEAGHSVYDRLVNEYQFPLLAANAVRTATGEPYFKPYTVIEKEGIKTVVFGMITTGVPGWLPPELYSGMEFDDLLETAKKHMPDILREKPDLVVGLFHTGWDGPEDEGGSHREGNGAYSVARNVPGFDVILCGHNHNVINTTIENIEGETVLVIEGGSRADKVGRVDVVFEKDKTTGKVHKLMKGSITDVKDFAPDNGFLKKLEKQNQVLLDYVNREIATFTAGVTSRDSYFGSSPFVDMIHRIQLDITKADLSFAAPLSFDVGIKQGTVTVGDMFKLYRFENLLYTMSLSGSEIRKYLEFSYSDWLNTMKGPADHMLKFRLDENGNPVIRNGEAWLKNQPYNFDSAVGIDYTVDISKPEGKRVSILSFSDGRPFDSGKRYNVALNSYRGNGGGGHLTEGARLNGRDLQGRLIRSTERDLRFYILEYLGEKQTITPEAYNNWKIIPDKWVKTARVRDYELLFGK